MSEVIRAAAKKWFYESFDCDLLEKMERAGLIAQAEGFSISVMADLELDMEAAFDRVTAERDAALRQVETITADRDAEKQMKAKARIQRDVQTAKATDLQERLTAADERADVLEGLLRDSKDVMSGIWDTSYDHEVGDALAALDLIDRIDASLKPAEGGGDEA